VKIDEYYDEGEIEPILARVLRWNFDVGENILLLLCSLDHEETAIKF
jgi:hypothetical protein